MTHCGAYPRSATYKILLTLGPLLRADPTPSNSTTGCCVSNGAFVDSSRATELVKMLQKRETATQQIGCRSSTLMVEVSLVSF